jgi:hypothetical protein
LALVGYRVTRLWLPDRLRFDAHLLPGDASADLVANILVDYVEIHDDRPAPVPRRSETAADATTRPAGGGDAPIQLVFTAGFRGSDVGAHHALGVTFVPATGVVTADNPLPDDRVENFLVKAVATARNGAETSTAEAWTRVHVHQSVERIWLTPNPMTIHEGSFSNPRFTLLGEFDDGVVADMTRIGDTVAAWRGRVTWTSNIATVTVTDTGRLEATARADAQITASFQPPGGGAPETDTATARVVPPWSDGADLTLVSGDADRRERVPNVLFMAEGFDESAADRDAFNRIVDTVVDGLRKNHLIYPWPLLHASVNFWSAFTAGRQAGATRRTEVYIKDPDAQNVPFFRVPEPEQPKPTDNKWTLAQLVHQIGLPVPDDAASDLDELLPELRARYGDHITKERIEDNFSRWIRLANRRLLNLRDSMLCFTAGERPRAKTPSGEDPNIFDTDFDRISNNDIHALLDGLRHNGTTIGLDHWGPTGRDRALVCVLTRSSGRSVASSDYFVASLAHGKTERASDAPHQQLELVPIELPKEGDDLNWLVYLFAHECGHAFGLGDEYGEGGIKKGDHFERFEEADATGVEESPNLHARATIRKVDPSDPDAANEIDASKIKWASWLRISHAAAVTTRPSVSGTELQLDVRSGALRFGDGERVRIRQVLLRRNAEHILEYNDPLRSGPLKVKRRPDDTHLVLEADGAPAIGETPLPHIGATVMTDVEAAPIIVYRPTRHPIPGSVQPTEVAVLSPLVAVHISTTDRPLNVKADEPYVCVIDDRGIQNPRNLPILPTQKPCYEPLIIGLYDGGRRFHCEVFHPGGVCNMRDHYEGENHRRFCQVCRYVLVDIIDPTKHGDLDAVYHKEYAY